ncbi:MAG: TlyA family RNA methyltransferase [Cellulomonadaceae bacterium]|nr:TlyA family RNA methyltransferase [Cellulomonadaceae bacterium]
MPAVRLDAELVRRGLARSRRRAGELVAEGRVLVDGTPAHKPSQPVSEAVAVVVEAGPAPEYVSRAGYKLDGALDALAALVAVPPRVEGAMCLDAGASTGGFTQVLLARGAAHVLAVDVGHGQMAASVAADPRVTVREGVNIRDLQAQDVEPSPTLVVADLSFISLTLVVPVLVGVSSPGADLLLMVKPQFEVGRGRLGPGGVVTSPARRQQAVLAVAEAVRSVGGAIHAVVPSPLPGPAGNHEYFLWATAPDGGRREVDLTGTLEDAVRTAVVDDRACQVRPPLRGVPRRLA